MQSDVQAGQVFVRAARQVGHGTEPKYRECPDLSVPLKSGQLAAMGA